MTKSVAWISPEASVAEAADRLASAPPAIICLLVGDDDRAPPEGIVTAVDMLRAALQTGLTPGRLDCACAHGRLVGVKDLACEGIFAQMARAARATPVRAIMSSPVRSVAETATAAQVMDLLIHQKIESVPVLRDGCVAGIVHRRTLLRALGGTMAASHA
jgi:signal-transduction protein with cAMP-binding, CBS, and nucleotidyltransferase domain